MCCQRVSNFTRTSRNDCSRASSDFFVCHCALDPNNKFALLQNFTHPKCFGNIARGNFCRMQIQRQFQSGMSSSSIRQQRCGYSGTTQLPTLCHFLIKLMPESILSRTCFTSTSWRIQKEDFSNVIIYTMHNLIINVFLLRR